MRNRMLDKSIAAAWCLSLAAILTLTAGSKIMARDALTESVPGRTITVRIPAVIDATLIESTDGQLANGAGNSLFVGRTQQPIGSQRRALVQFDVASVVPRRAIIEDVTLTLTVAQGNAPSIAVGVHRVMQPWSEGSSSSGGGMGALAMPGDTTWLHRSYDLIFWRRPGGTFLRRPSAMLLIEGAGVYSWRDPYRRPRRLTLRNDVLLWLRAPERNFGWLLRGGEDEPRTAKKINSRESTHPEARPVLEINYRMPL